jgi:hypothetical protein
MFKLNNDDKLSFFALKVAPSPLCRRRRGSSIWRTADCWCQTTCRSCSSPWKKGPKLCWPLHKPRGFQMSTAKVYCHTYTVSIPYFHTPFSQLSQADTTEYTQSGTIATFWHTFHHDGKISLVWWGGMHARPLSLYLRCCARMLALAERADTLPYFISTPIKTLWL